MVEVLPRIISMYPDNSTMANYAMKLRTAVKVYNVTDMVDGYICTKSISAAMASFNFDVFGQTTMKDESGQPIYPETAPSTVSGIAHTDSIEDVLPERNHSRADSSMYTGATVQLDTRSQSLEPRRVYQVQARRFEFRAEV
jgi:hypothetical protein